MIPEHDPTTRAALEEFLKSHGLSGDTRLYRQTLAQFLTPGGEAGTHHLSGNPTPSESVIDVYGQGHLIQAEHAGPGLAFAQSKARDWQETMEMEAVRDQAAHILSGGQDDASSSDALEVTAEWSGPGRVPVEVRLQDVLDQGGLVYPVESVITERVWYCTLPAGGVQVREVN